MADSTKEYRTIQTGIKNNDIESTDMMSYALFMGGLNVTRDSLTQYNPLVTGYGRLFCVSAPKFVESAIPSMWGKFKHILEYGNTSVQGINDLTMNFQSISGGYAGRSFEIPTHMTDDTNQFSVTCYEMSGSPLRQTIHFWLNGIADTNTGLTHYNGYTDVTKSQKNQTAEFIYVSTDSTGENIEYACMFCNCIPKTIKNDQFNYQSGTHDLVEYQIEFTCTKYESIQINGVAQALIDRYKIVTNSMNMYSGYNNYDTAGATDNQHYSFGYNPNNGKLDAAYANKTDACKPRDPVPNTISDDNKSIITYDNVSSTITAETTATTSTNS